MFPGSYRRRQKSDAEGFVDRVCVLLSPASPGIGWRIGERDAQSLGAPQ